MEFVIGLFLLMLFGIIPLALVAGGIALIVGAISKVLGK